MSKPPTLRLDRLLANLGYGSRREVQQLVRCRLVTLDGDAGRRRRPAHRRRPATCRSA